MSGSKRCRAFPSPHQEYGSSQQRELPCNLASIHSPARRKGTRISHKQQKNARRRERNSSCARRPVQRREAARASARGASMGPRLAPATTPPHPKDGCTTRRRRPKTLARKPATSQLRAGQAQSRPCRRRARLWPVFSQASAPADVALPLRISLHRPSGPKCCRTSLKGDPPQHARGARATRRPTKRGHTPRPPTLMQKCRPLR
mmetsp:Transcript_28380/g.85571  ORF Transcript_28380/g.85571 Transcript_28380/m.85571 type:complete len:204 (+) Transcript_28380:1117-1728(+)